MEPIESMLEDPKIPDGITDEDREEVFKILLAQGFGPADLLDPNDARDYADWISKE